MFLYFIIFQSETDRISDLYLASPICYFRKQANIEQLRDMVSHPSISYHVLHERQTGICKQWNTNHFPSLLFGRWCLTLLSNIYLLFLLLRLRLLAAFTFPSWKESMVTKRHNPVSSLCHVGSLIWWCIGDGATLIFSISPLWHLCRY